MNDFDIDKFLKDNNETMLAESNRTKTLDQMISDVKIYNKIKRKMFRAHRKGKMKYPQVDIDTTPYK